MDYNARKAALDLAASLPGVKYVDDLLRAAQAIENHLARENLEPIAPREPNKIDFRAVLPVEHDDPVIGQRTGFAQDLVRMFNSGNTLVLKGRNVGLTTLLIEYAEERRALGENVLFIAPKTAHPIFDEKATKATWRETDSDCKLIATTFKSLGESIKGTSIDLIIVDGLGFLPYGEEATFLATIAPLAARCIFVSEATQERGLFHDMWKRSTTFQKITVPWYAPLYLTQRRTAEKANFTMSPESFLSQMECAFRIVG